MSARTVEATAPLALQALVEHMLEHQLPAPSAITPPSPYNPDLEVWVASPEAAAWTDTVRVVDEDTLPAAAVNEISTTGPWERVRLTVEIGSPVGDVRVVLLYLRRLMRPLHFVAGSAS